MSGFKPTRQANNVRPPVVGEVTAIVTTAGSVPFVTPAAWSDVYVTAMADADDVFLTFGGATVTADPAAAAGIVGSPGALTNDADSVIKIPDGSFMSFRVPPEATHFAIIGAAGGGMFRLWLSSN